MSPELSGIIVGVFNRMHIIFAPYRCTGIWWVTALREAQANFDKPTVKKKKSTASNN